MFQKSFNKFILICFLTVLFFSETSVSYALKVDNFSLISDTVSEVATSSAFANVPSPIPCSWDGRVWYETGVNAGTNALYTYNVFTGQNVMVASLDRATLDIAWGADGNLYLTDYSTTSATFFRVNTSTGTTTPVMSSPFLNKIVGIGSDQYGWIYFVSRANANPTKVYRWNVYTNVMELWIDLSLSPYNYSSTLATTGDIIFEGSYGYISITDATNRKRLIKIGPFGADNKVNASTSAITTAYIPLANGLAMGNSGQGFVLTSGNDMYAITPSSTGVSQTYLARLAAPAGGLTYGSASIIEAASTPCSGQLAPTYDFGDAPDSYKTLLASDGARHLTTGILAFGDYKVDPEYDGQPNASATGDNVGGSLNDEVAITSFPAITSGATSYTLSNIPVSNYSDYDLNSRPANVYAWIDFNRDGIFQSNEAATTTVPAIGSTTQINLNWTNLSGVVAGQTYARFRITYDTLTNTATGNSADTRSYGLANNGEVEDYTLTISPSLDISGKVFEDLNYGGGAGRSFVSSSGIGRSNTRVELYDASGNFVNFTTTDASGNYTFVGPAAGDYTVRVVNNTVTSSRSGYTAGLLPVQTYRTDASSGTVVADTNRVGGESPNLSDAGNGSTTLSSLTTAQSIAPVKLGSSAVTGVDFGYNFDTIVNTNDSGQGSLRQFILNSNSLGGELGLSQNGSTANTIGGTNSLPIGKETSIFMIPDGGSHAGLRAGLVNQLTGGVAKITALSVMNLAGANAPNTIVDGGTQTANIGNTNSANLSSGGSVGLSGSLNYSSFDGPEIQLIGGGSSAFDGFAVQSNDITIRNLAMRFFKFAITTNSGNPVGLLVENNVLGTEANSFTDPGTGTGRSDQQITIQTSGSSASIPTLIARNNLIGFSEHRGIHIVGQTSGAGLNYNLQIYSNEFKGAGNATNFTSATAGSIEIIDFVTPHLEIYNNKIEGRGAPGSPAGSNGIEINNDKVGAAPAINAGTCINNCRIENNSISNTFIGLLIKATDLDTLAMDGLSINQNVMSTNSYGLYNSGDSQNITQNQVSNNLNIGIANIGQSVNITKNIISANGTDGVAIGDTGLRSGGRTSSVIVQENQVFGNGRTGILGVNTGTQVLITKNSTYNNGKLGIDLIPQSSSVTYGVTANDGAKNAAQANQQTDYPIFTQTSLVGSNLFVKGFVGNAAGQTLFANSTIEIFKASNDGNQDGEVILGDGSSKPHGEGQTYLATITTDANGNFSATIPVSGLSLGDFVTATATDSLNNTSEFSADYQLAAGIPIVNLLKSCPSPADCTTAPQIPGTDLTYKIEFTNSGLAAASNLMIVDQIPDNTDYKINSAAVNTATTGLTIIIEYSDNYDPSNPISATWNYTPVSGGGSADTGYDRLVKAVRWRVTTGTLSNISANNTGDVSFITKIR